MTVSVVVVENRIGVKEERVHVVTAGGGLPTVNAPTRRIDGGRADSVYTSDQRIHGGGAASFGPFRGGA